MTATVAPSEWLTARQAAAYLGTTPHHLGVMRYEGRGPKWYKPTGRMIYYRRAEIDAWIEGGDARQ
ncbi:hypothetical protein PSRA_1268 [Pseudoscardovia radai]|uniref:Helix-turn-helix domain-containing protein n=1 Tax=Pseudoscardovia radai TaxID=987066 RepID=A0A261EX38_9BIFI|nr:helix-turn-helix domain-containing protein [Pseudoscardovia radai]OZG51226.1 hypothetical protein PSRA_1268 [Pseudoscardovia radai]